jgi:hypothetical protein
MSAHLSIGRIGDYLVGAGPDQGLEEHVSECAECAALLQAEAQIDLALAGIVDGAVVERLAPVRSGFARFAVHVGVPLVLAASVLLALAGTAELATHAAPRASESTAPPVEHTAPIYLADSSVELDGGVPAP